RVPGLDVDRVRLAVRLDLRPLRRGQLRPQPPERDAEQTEQRQDRDGGQQVGLHHDPGSFAGQLEHHARQVNRRGATSPYWDDVTPCLLHLAVQPNGVTCTTMRRAHSAQNRGGSSRARGLSQTSCTGSARGLPQWTQYVLTACRRGP